MLNIMLGFVMRGRLDIIENIRPVCDAVVDKGMPDE
jgi:hypothetical protein